MSPSLTFTRLKKDARTAARRGRMVLSHGIVETPVFMPVGTLGAVKGLWPRDLTEIGTQILLGNTYHLYLRPGHERVRRLGGLHRLMAWEGPILTDSGGFQVYSLAKIRKIREEGVEFQSHLDGSRHLLTPELSMAIQMALGSDIAMAFDECVAATQPRDIHAESLERTTRWETRCLASHPSETQALFGIVQGGTFEDLRVIHAEQIRNLPFDGFAIGGLSVGESTEEMYRITEITTPLLPEEKPRYLMGVGSPQNLIECVARGVDMFDCVMPTRHARHGDLFTSRGRLHLKNARYQEDESPPDPACSCYTCRHFSRAALRHLVMAGELNGLTLGTLHNLHYYLSLMEQIRRAIDEDRFPDFARETLARMEEGEIA